MRFLPQMIVLPDYGLADPIFFDWRHGGDVHSLINTGASPDAKISALDDRSATSDTADLFGRDGYLGRWHLVLADLAT